MNLFQKLKETQAIWPIVNFRIIFGLLVFVGTLRTILLGWVDKFYLQPQFFFKFYGFEWVEVWGGSLGIYTVFSLLLLSALGIMLGAFYRFSSILFFLLFSYTELLDVTNYLNHYYLVSCIAFLICWLPANRAFSIDAWLWPKIRKEQVAKWTVFVLQLQLAIVYFYAGLAKIHPDWLFEAQPMRIWLARLSDFPLLGSYLAWPITALIFSWVGLVFDLSIPFLLCWRKSRPYAYLLVVVFHLMTGLLFYIGMFPYFMIGMTIIFFSDAWHKKIIAIFELVFILTLSKLKQGNSKTRPYREKVPWEIKLRTSVLIAFFSFQLLFPLRHWLYPGNVLWTEEGFRFAWKVMVVEKNATATFTISDGKKESLVNNRDFLTAKQEVMMSYQADLILQFAKYLADVYQKRGYQNPEVRVNCQVALNGRLSRPYIDPKVNLAKQPTNLWPKPWIIRYQANKK